MTIKEMEEKTGISRSNIRFYETEGLIRPVRRENGYRDYSGEDAEILRKIRLLRSMEVPLERIKAVITGASALTAVLAELETELDRRQAQQERTRLLLRQLIQSGVEFESLEPEPLLELLDSEAPVEDAPPRLNLPWRRYWARSLDLSLYGTLVTCLTYDFLNREYLQPILTLAAMLMLEPLLLRCFCTTPGKAIFGIRVTDPEGGRLDYGTAMERTWTVMWEGMAMNIPLISWYFQFKSMDLAEQELPLSWENASELTCKDDKIWRYGLFFAVNLGQVALIFLAARMMGG